MANLRLAFIGLLFVTGLVKAQTDTLIYFESHFETIEDQQQWTSIPSDNVKKWTYQEGGNELNPDTAYDGELNAYHYWSDYVEDKRSLVSDPIDLSDAKKPLLTFGHAMLQSVFGTDKLDVLFKAGPSASWDTIVTYTTPLTQWADRSINIVDYGTKYLCEGFQLAFHSTARGGHGNCIDNVIIEEKDIILRSVKSLNVRHVAQGFLPSGSVDIPLLRVDVVVIGNTDPMVLDSIVFTSLSSHDSLFATNGFELVATTDSIYRPVDEDGGSLKIGGPVSISVGKVSFDNLNDTLATGYHALWLIADIKNTAPHKSVADFKVEAYSVNLNDSILPVAEASPAGSNLIEHAVFLDGFEGASSWSLDYPDFEIDEPQGYVAQITQDPDFAYSGNKVLGTDLLTDGKYLLNIGTGSEYYATTPAIDLQYFTDIKMGFKGWNAFEGNDQAVIEVSNDNGSSWTKIWDSRVDKQTPDNDWITYKFTDEFNDLVAHKSQVKVRFGVVYSDGSFAYAGFNIDNFAITGNYLTNDVGITQIMGPVDDCHNPGMDTVKIVVRNYADRATTTSIPVYFSITGDSEDNVYETIPGPIPVDDSVIYAFTQTADFPSAGDYSNFKVGVMAGGDQDPLNDTMTHPVYIQKSISIPHTEDFETGGGYWKVYGESATWECKTPEGSIPPISGSPNAWILSPYGNYLTSDTSYIESSCYDLATLERSVFEMQLWLDSESGKDGALIEYSTDEGETWEILTAHEYSWDWNWYDGKVTALDTNGWSGLNVSNWKMVKQVLPAGLSTEVKVRFRVKWASDENNTYRGMAIDDLKIYSAPVDIGIAQIDSFDNRCQNINPDKLTVTIENMGINPLYENDTIIVGFEFDDIPMAVDTFALTADLLPGAVVKHTFDETVDVSDPGTYNLTAFTLIEDDPYYYESNNDTLSLDFEVYPGPLTSLTDTIQTYMPDTVTLETIYNADYDYWWNGTPGTNTYDIVDHGWQYLTVTATRGNGCTSYDSTNVELLFNDTGADSLIHPTDHCGLTTEEYLIVRVRNFGTDSINAGQKIAVMYELDEGPPVSDTLELMETLYAGRTIDFTFTKGPVDLSSAGTYSFKVYTSYGGDTIAANDTIVKSIDILGRPTISLGPDIVVEALSYEIDAGTGYTAYLWDDGSDLQTREVTETGDYWVTVYDANMCDNSDTVFIRLKIRDISPGGFINPVSDCQYNSAEQVQLQVLNSGTDTIPSGTSIDVSYVLNGGTRVTGITTLAADLMPDEYVIHTFPGTVDLGSSADYDFEATTVMTGDIRISNDTSDITVYRYDAPVVDFELDDTEFIEAISYNLDAGYSPFLSYLWQDGFDEYQYNVTTSGNYRVIATDTRTSCFDGDTVTIMLIYSDVGVTWTDLADAGCTGYHAGVTVRVNNMGTTNIGASAPIYVACDVEGSRVLIDTLTRTSNFAPGTSLDLELTDSVLVNTGGMNSVSFYTIYAQDMKDFDDTLTMDFDALQGPIVDFGDVDGELEVTLPHILDAGAGHKAYLWQDGSDLQTYTVTVNGIYSVTVTGQNDCKTFKSVRINMQSGIGELQGELSPLTIYPNPNNGLFNITTESDALNDLVLRIFNNRGQEVFVRKLNAFELENEQINVQHLLRGIYHIIISSDTQVYQGKMVIQ